MSRPIASATGGSAARALGTLERRSPGAFELAVLTATAMSIEPELLRSVRLVLAPHLGADAEGDLWVSDIVDSREYSAITIIPAVGDLLRTHLRQRLADQPELQSGLYQLLHDLHSDWPASLALEEQIRWIAVTEREDLVAASIEPLLAQVVEGVRDEGRIGLARWAGRAVRRLPGVAFRTASAPRLVQLLHARGVVPSSAVGTLSAASEPLTIGDVSDLVDRLGFTVLGVRRTGDRLELGDVGAGGSAIRVPANEPRIVEVDGSTVHIPRGDRVERPVGWESIELRTAAGDLYRIDPEPPQATMVLDAACVLVESKKAITIGIIVGFEFVITVGHDEPPLTVRLPGQEYRYPTRARKLDDRLWQLQVDRLPEGPIPVLEALPNLADGGWFGRGVLRTAPSSPSRAVTRIHQATSGRRFASRRGAPPFSAAPSCAGLRSPG